MKPAKTIALAGVLTTLGLALSYLESLIPLPVGIPGVKLGLANLVVLIALNQLGTKTALVVSLLRIALASLLFGTAVSAAYALSGGLLSFLIMWALLRSGKFSTAGVSLAGGAAHNLGQLAAAAVVLGTVRVVAYLPALLLCGVTAGALNGVCAAAVLHRLPQQL